MLLCLTLPRRSGGHRGGNAMACPPEASYPSGVTRGTWDNGTHSEGYINCHRSLNCITEMGKSSRSSQDPHGWEEGQGTLQSHTHCPGQPWSRVGTRESGGSSTDLGSVPAASLIFLSYLTSKLEFSTSVKWTICPPMLRATHYNMVSGI